MRGYGPVLLACFVVSQAIAFPTHNVHLHGRVQESGYGFEANSKASRPNTNPKLRAATNTKRCRIDDPLVCQKHKECFYDTQTKSCLARDCHEHDDHKTLCLANPRCTYRPSPALPWECISKKGAAKLLARMNPKSSSSSWSMSSMGDAAVSFCSGKGVGLKGKPVVAGANKDCIVPKTIGSSRSGETICAKCYQCKGWMFSEQGLHLFSTLDSVSVDISSKSVGGLKSCLHTPAPPPLEKTSCVEQGSFLVGRKVANSVADPGCGNGSGELWADSYNKAALLCNGCGMCNNWMWVAAAQKAIIFLHVTDKIAVKGNGIYAGTRSCHG